MADLTFCFSRLGERGIGSAIDPIRVGPMLEPFTRNETDEQYHARNKDGRAESSHSLADFRACPANYRQKRLGHIKDKDTAVYRFGRAGHVLICEGPAAYAARYVAGGPINPRTGKCYRDTSKKFQAWAAKQSKEALTTDQHNDLARMAVSVRECNPDSAKLLSFGWAELVFRAVYCGRPCQIRTDFLNPYYGFADLKTCADLDAFEIDAESFGYIYQLAFYRAMLRIAVGVTLPAYLIPIEKKEPFRCEVWQVNADRLDDAERENEEAIRTLAKCEALNSWPYNYEAARALPEGGSNAPGVHGPGNRSNDDSRRPSRPEGRSSAAEARRREPDHWRTDEFVQALAPNPLDQIGAGEVPQGQAEIGTGMVPPPVGDRGLDRAPTFTTTTTSEKEDMARFTRGRVEKPRRIMIYGQEGVGKSSWAADAPGAIILPTEEGANDIEAGAKMPLATTHDEFLANVTEIWTNAGGEYSEFRWIVVDSGDWLERLICRHLCAVHQVEAVAQIGGGYGKHVEFITKAWGLVLQALDALRAKGMGIILVCHADFKKFNDPESEGYDQYVPRLMKESSHVIREWCDEVFFARFRTHTRQIDAGFNKVDTKAVGTGERILRTTFRPAAVAKNRLPGIPDELPLKWSAFADYLPGGPKYGKAPTPTAPPAAQAAPAPATQAAA